MASEYLSEFSSVSGYNLQVEKGGTIIQRGKIL